jgi:DNA invertase Pin-like site-specific DNA recombinase
MLTVLGGIAQFEREIMLERQREGVAKAKAQGKYKGRKPIAMDRQQEVIRLVKSGISKASIAKQLRMGEASVYRILRKSNENSIVDTPKTALNFCCIAPQTTRSAFSTTNRHLRIYQEII